MERVAEVTEAAAARERPAILVLATGGTIAGIGPRPDQPGYAPGRIAIEELLESIPPIAGVARVLGEQLAAIGSQDVDDALWLKLARRVNQALAAPQVDGVVVTHGTDTLEETAYFLHLVVDSDKPVVMTGAMRPATGMSADGPANLYDAIAVAADPESRGRGVLVVINDDIHSAHDIAKTHTTDVHSFSSREAGLVGVTLLGKQQFYRAPSQVHTSRSELRLGEARELPRVDILYAHAGMSSDLIDAAVERGARGLVMAGVGEGNLSAPALAAVARAGARGVAVVRASRVGGGMVRRNLEVDDDRLGTVAAMWLGPPKARVLLQLALLRTSDPARIQDLFDRY